MAETLNVAGIHHDGMPEVQLGLRNNAVLIKRDSVSKKVCFIDVTTGENVKLDGVELEGMNLTETPSNPILNAIAYFGNTTGTKLLASSFELGAIAVLPNIFSTNNFIIFSDGQTVKDSGISLTQVNNLIKATTLSGYGITDAYTKTQVDGLVASVFKYKGSVASYSALPTTNRKTGDVYNITSAGGTDAHGTTIKAGDNVAWNGSGWDVLAGTIDLSSYATTAAMNTALNNKANKSTTLSGYGITDAYTKATVDSLVNAKAAKSTTLSGYGITDAYTKAQTDAKIPTVTVSTTAPSSTAAGKTGDLWIVYEA